MASTALILEGIPRLFCGKARNFLGIDNSAVSPTLWSRVGLAFSGLFLLTGGVWIGATSERLPFAVWVTLSLAGLVVLGVSGMKRLSLGRTNVLTLTTHLSALFGLYFLITRFLVVTYSTDTIVGTYAGLIGVLQLQNPYLYSIKPFLDQFGLPPSYYTPRVDGSFEFRLNYPAFNFLSLVPVYLLGFHDVRDGILFFHVISVLVIFGLAPPRIKSASIAPLVFGIPLAVAFSWTDSVWASLLVLGVVGWHRDRRLGLVFVGLAGATKQIAFVVAPFLLIRLLHESSSSKLRKTVLGLSALLTGFFAPNIPFILLSPPAWWAGTVAAYLPGNAPQIVAGVGLSEILIGLGISLPSYFYIVMMAATTVGLGYLYNIGFPRYRHLAWAMPIPILFFYYRSFPNYMIYWLLPFLAEVFRGKRGLPSFHLAPMFSMTRWNPSIHLPLPSLSSLRRRMTSSGLVVLVLAAVLAGVSGAYISRASESRVQVQVDKILDLDSIGAVTVLEVKLANIGTESVSPRFFVKWNVLPFLWTATSNSTLHPGEEASYNVTTTDGRAAVPTATPFKVLVFNSLDGNLVGQSQTVVSDLPTPNIANPNFRWWTLDSETGRKVPFGWQLGISGPSEASGISEIDSALSEGLHLMLNHTLPAPYLQEIAVSPRRPFDASSLRVLALMPTQTEPLDEFVFGVRFTDATHTLYYLFSTSASDRTVHVHPENTTIIAPIVSGEWTQEFIDLSIEWFSLGWPLPGSTEFSIVLRSSSAGIFNAYVREVA